MSEPLASSIMACSTDGCESSTGPDGAGDDTSRSKFPIPWEATWILLVSLSAIVSSGMVVWLRSDRGLFVPVLAIAVCLLAALFDAWTTRIPNALTYTAIVLGVALNVLASVLFRVHAETATRWLDAPGMSQSMMGLGVCAGLGIVGLMVARVGGGDIKLLAALGAMLGLAQVGSVMIVALGVALIYSLLNLALFGRLNFVARVMAMRALELVYFRRIELPAPNEEGPSPEKTPRLHDTVPMAIPLVIGLIIAEVLHIQAWMGGGG